MLTPTVANRFAWLYAVGNTPATSLTRSIPHGQDACILSLGCGDLRNILLTLHTDKALPPRKLDITCCDVDAKVLARNFILLTLIINESDDFPSDTLWDVYYHLKFNEATAKLLHGHVEQLIPLLASEEEWNKSQYGSTLQFCDADTRNEIKSLCEKISISPEKLGSNAYRKQFKQCLDESVALRVQTFGSGTIVTGMRSAAPLSLRTDDKLPLVFEQFWKDGTVVPDQSASLPNPMFAALTSDDALLHYGSDPVLGYHLATAFAPLADTSVAGSEEMRKKFQVAAAAKKQFADWVSSFRQSFRNKLVLRFVASDAFAFCHTLQHVATTGETSANWYRRQWDSKPLRLQGTPPTVFDMIDTSNLSDHFGTLNLLVSCTPLLRKQPWATIFTDSLVQQKGSQKKAFAKLLRGHAPTLSLLLGLTPVQYWSNAKCESHVDEVFLGLTADAAESDEQQIHGSLCWKLADQAGNTAGDQIKLEIEPKSLARVIFHIYLEMFESEKPPQNLSSTTARSAAYGHFHRGSFVALLKVIKQRVKTDWSSMCRELLDTIARDTTLMLGSNQMQELGAQLHLSNVLTESWILNNVKKGQSVGLLKRWANIPPTVAITVVIQRKALERLYGASGNRMASPTLVGTLKSSPGAASHWHNIYGDVHIAFGKVRSSRDEATGEDRVELEEDKTGWAGTSALIASFVVPTSAIQVEPETALVGVSVVPTGQNAMLYGPVLGMSMDVFLTNVSNTGLVHASRFMPNHAGHRVLCAGAEKSTETGSVGAGRLLVEIPPSETAFITLTGHADIISDKGKALLKDKTPITIRQKNPFVLEIVFGHNKLVQPLVFLAPVTSEGIKTRVARTSGYVEVVAPLAAPAGSKCLEDFLFPTVLTSQGLPVSLNTPHLNLDGLPILDVTKQEEMRWLTTLTSLQFSERELALRETAHSKTGIAEDARVNFKESLFTMFMMVSGQQGGETGLFAITHPERGGIHMLIFVSAMRLDCAAASVVLDAAVIPMTMDLVTSGRMEEFLLLLRSLECCTVNVNDAELDLWKKNLPAMAERCRTWSHGPDCEYKKKKSVPVGLGQGEQVLCSCGAGALPENFVSLPSWEESAKPNATRIAISPTYSIPFVESVVDLDKLAQGQESAGKERCRNCGKTETPDGGALKKCLRCQKVKYCSGECQKKDWKKHRMECREVDEP